MTPGRFTGTGNARDNVITGAGKNDTLNGGGHDKLMGLGGDDRLDGGTGDDIFRFRRREASGDAVTDFIGNGNAARDDPRAPSLRPITLPSREGEKGLPAVGAEAPAAGGPFSRHESAFAGLGTSCILPALAARWRVPASPILPQIPGRSPRLMG